ncbi:MAG: PEP-CTERM sorting domain-containing protein, partial [Planctomycetota bacterium]
VKRWISEVAGEITILGTLADIEGGYGDGILGHIFADDVEIWSQRIHDGDYTGVEYMVSATVDIGSVIDFAVSPGPHSNDYRDLTRFTMIITPEPATLLLLGLGGLPLLRRREVSSRSLAKG